jgi:branched-chain amino acid transport system ATP-binding protein
VSISYGQLRIVFDVSFSVGAGEIVALIGPNGAGKTTILRAISGILAPSGGSIELLGARIDGLEPCVIAARGIAHVPEGRELFPSLSVERNLQLGAVSREARAEQRESLAFVFSLFPVLQERRHQAAATLSGGEQQMVAIGRGIMAVPKLLVLDEPSLGLSPLMVNAIFEAFREVNARGTTILLVEQNVVKTLSLADRAYVLESGRLVMEGTGRELLKAPHVRDAYLGTLDHLPS